MTGTIEDIKKAQKIITKARNFFIYYRAQLKKQQQRNLDNRSEEYLLYYNSKLQAELTAINEIEPQILELLEAYTDANDLLHDKENFSDKELLQKIILRASRIYITSRQH
jgi:DNA-binding transcriptional regulator GbsR (MarR family)